MPHQALRTILPIAEWSGDPAASVTFTGGTDPVLPTPFRIGVAEDRAAVTRAVAGWNAADLEEAIIAAKGAGGMVRSQAEWTRHPQAAAIAALPLMEIVRIGDSPPEPLPAGDRPLGGIRVL